MRRLWHALRPAVFWTYRRGSWQYDVIVALILVFIFVTPRSWFRDQPRPQQIVMLHGEQGSSVYLIDPGLVPDSTPERLQAQIRPLLEKRIGRKLAQLEAEPVKDSEGHVKGYLARVKL